MELSINGESVQVDLVSKETPLREYIKTKVSAPGREVFLHCEFMHGIRCVWELYMVANYSGACYKTMLLDSS